MIKDEKQKYAVVDLEATSAGPLAKIIQVGIVILSEGSIIDSYQTDVNPHEPLSEHIKTLTGITDEQLSMAPEFSQVAGKIFELIEGCVFVAHNVKFDANLLAEALFWEGYELHCPRVDTVELSQIVFPTLEKYSLTALSEELGIVLSDAHTAIADAFATAELLVAMMTKLSSLPSTTLKALQALSDNLVFETGLVISEVCSCKEAVDDHQEFDEVLGLVLRHPQQKQGKSAFYQDFEDNLIRLGYDARAKQKEVAAIISREYTSATPQFIQAQSGIGKTFAYLLGILPKLDKEKLIVAVPTKVLQDQLMTKEIAEIQQKFDLSVANVKSPSNFLHLERFYQTLTRSGDSRMVNRYKMQLLVWLTETETGDLDEIRQKQRSEVYFEELRHDGQLEATSLFYDYDFWHRLQKQVIDSKLIITNHAYLLSRLANDPTFVSNQVLVIDEAQKLFLTLQSNALASISLSETLAFVERLQQSEIPQLTRRLLESLHFELIQLIDQAPNQREILQQTVEQLRQDLSELSYPELEPFKRLLSLPTDVFWLERDDLGQVMLNVASVHLSQLSEYLPDLKKLYLISATLDISSNVRLPMLLGVADYEYHVIPTEKKTQQKVFVDCTMPNIKAVDSDVYHALLAERIRALSAYSLPCLVLFTSKKSMLQVSSLLDTYGVHHLAQEKHGIATAIKRRFDKGETSLLLGLGSFWEGTDFIQQQNMLLVVTRLPFESPHSVFVQKMYRYLKEKGLNPFEDYSLPSTILRLKQALGRSKRDDKQKSVAVILDSRLIQAEYGHDMMASLSEDVLVSSRDFSEIEREITEFLL